MPYTSSSTDQVINDIITRVIEAKPDSTYEEVEKLFREVLTNGTVQNTMFGAIMFKLDQPNRNK